VGVSSLTAFGRASVVPQDDEAARAARVRELAQERLGTEAAATLAAEGAALDRERSAELGVAALAR